LVETTLALFLPQEGEIAVLGDVTDMVRPDHRCGLTAERVTESATPAVVPGNCGRAMVRWRGSIGRRFTQPRFAARNPASVRGCADLAISAPIIESILVGVSADLAKSPDNSGLSALAGHVMTYTGKILM
jgi:hypothetical protein